MLDLVFELSQASVLTLCEGMLHPSEGYGQCE